MQLDALNKAIITTKDSCVTAGLFKISFKESEKGAMTSCIRELSPLPHEVVHQPIFDSEDRDGAIMDDAIMDDAADDQSSCPEQKIIVKDLDAIYKDNQMSVLDSPRSLCTDSICDNSTVLRDWSTTASNVTVQDTPVLREWVNSTIENKEEKPQNGKDSSCDDTKGKQNVKKNRSRRHL